MQPRVRMLKAFRLLPLREALGALGLPMVLPGFLDSEETVVMATVEAGAGAPWVLPTLPV